MGRLYNDLNCGMNDRLFFLSMRENYDYSQVRREYERRRDVIGFAYYWKFKGRESHILANAYIGTVNHFKSLEKCVGV